MREILKQLIENGHYTESLQQYFLDNVATKEIYASISIICVTLTANIVV